ncbi:Amino Acid-Polyamine-Organocation (APC) Family [Thraustotheca clavata]|uniref:Amino Acid-Polyamine-Organocation (APC) Family n=1 Tax=Thraustotheca clavata TaxID=74557 RepID=A0A1V9ZP42_9STRA|nr:Amino Acid-Polyamine-Organocation (APC) Family [Thraustotheca clavata]
MLWKQLWQRKTLEAILAEEKDAKLERQLTLLDLIAIGIGGTVGTGVFATTGLIIANSAGPAAVVSWILGGFVCLLNGFAYMELSCIIPSSGSTYAYAYHALGELPAAIAGWLLFLEYGISGAGVARSWGLKVQLFAQSMFPEYSFQWLNEDYYSLASVVVQGISVVIMIFGLPIGKKFVNFVTFVKVCLVLFIISAGLAVYNPVNMTPFLPTQYGERGLMLGVTQAFFGYIGFDEVCCLAAEAKNPQAVMPKAVIGTILGTMILSTMASLTLAGMQPCEDIVDFATAFEVNQLPSAAMIVRVGEILTMPVVVLISFLAQPRVTYAMAIDGLLPPIFAKVDAHGNLLDGTLIAGALCTVVALVVPFEHLWDLISFAILVAFNMSNTSLILLRTRAESNHSVVPLVILAGTSMFTLQYSGDSTVWLVIALLQIVGVIVASTQLKMATPSLDEKIFRVPCMPWLPVLAMTLNWYLVSQMALETLVLGLAWMVLGALSYFMYGYSHSIHRERNPFIASPPHSHELHPLIL